MEIQLGRHYRLQKNLTLFSGPSMIKGQIFVGIIPTHGTRKIGLQFFDKRFFYTDENPDWPRIVNSILPVELDCDPNNFVGR